MVRSRRDKFEYQKKKTGEEESKSLNVFVKLGSNLKLCKYKNVK